MIVDWLAYSCPKKENNLSLLSNIYGNLELPKSCIFLPCGTRITNKPREGILDIDMSSKSLSFYKFQNLKNIIFLEDFHIRRLDIAYDDRDGILSMEKIWDSLEKGCFTSKFQNFTKLDSIQRTKKKVYKGETFYLGKRSSHSFIRIYDKYQESYKIFSHDSLSTAKKRLRDLKQHKNFIRVEIELKQKNADHIFRKLISEEFDPKSYLYKLIDFKEHSFGRIDRRFTDYFWLKFLSDIEKSSLGLPKPFWSLETLEKWIDKQIAPTLYGYTKHKSEKELLNLIKNSSSRFTKQHDKKFKDSKRLLKKEKRRKKNENN